LCLQGPFIKPCGQLQLRSSISTKYLMSRDSDGTRNHTNWTKKAVRERHTDHGGPGYVDQVHKAPQEGYGLSVPGSSYTGVITPMSNSREEALFDIMENLMGTCPCFRTSMASTASPQAVTKFNSWRTTTTRSTFQILSITGTRKGCVQIVF